MRRGHVYEIVFKGSAAHVLVVTSDNVNEHTGSATCVMVYPATDISPSIVDVPVGRPSQGTVILGAFKTFSRPVFAAGTDLGEIDPRAMEAVEIGLRAVFDL
ncbi:hypothetical protein ACFQLX_15320 [Streptomyces polyrhachis]|uniref:mRNA interferase MazF n=1 Tax=Streptomyces polyrhachis TaxID=1282885 RepID=A0ABW2GK51_9ACTN